MELKNTLKQQQKNMNNLVVYGYIKSINKSKNADILVNFPTFVDKNRPEFKKGMHMKVIPNTEFSFLYKLGFVNKNTTFRNFMFLNPYIVPLTFRKLSC